MKNAGWYIAAVVAIAVSWLLLSPYMAYAVYAFLLLVIAANLSSMAWLLGLECERAIRDTTLQQGQDTEVQVTVTNRRGFPIPWLYCEDQHPADTPRHGAASRLAVLMPGRSLTIRYRLTFPRRGYHRVGPMIMESGDLFGLQRRFRTGNRQDYVSVLPTVAYIETFNIASKRPQGPVRVANRIYQDPTHIRGIREYVPGDPLNTIHWKATARTGTLHVKTHEPTSVQGGTLVLDFHGDSYLPENKEERMELAVTTTASIAYLLQMAGEQVGMLTNARDAAEIAKYEVEQRESLSKDEARASIVGEDDPASISPLSVHTTRSPLQAQRIAENLARVLPGYGLDCEQLLMTGFRALPRDAALLPVTPHVTPALALTLGMLKQHGFQVSVFYIKDRKGYEEAAALLAQYDIYTFHIEHERNLHELNPARIGQ
ncbi:MAG: DUF58 domain-containing protein [Candidatus Hydrogenedentota bacterium]